MNEILTFFGGSVIGGFIGYYIKHYLDLRSARKLDEMNNKRSVYEDMIESMNIFISGRNQSNEKKDKLLTSYARLWLWGSDDVVRAISEQLHAQIEAAQAGKADQTVLKQKFSNAVIEMRKDIMQSDTTLTNEDYKFVKF